MTFYHTPIDGSLRPNPDIKPSFKKGDFVVLKKDCMSTRDPDGPTKCLIKGESFEIYECGLSEHEISKTKINSKGEILEDSKALSRLNDIEWCVLEVDTDFCTGRIVNAEDLRLLTAEDLENDDFY